MTAVRNFGARFTMIGLLIASICMPAVAMAMAYGSGVHGTTPVQGKPVPMQYMTVPASPAR